MHSLQELEERMQGELTLLRSLTQHASDRADKACDLAEDNNKLAKDNADRMDELEGQVKKLLDILHEPIEIINEFKGASNLVGRINRAIGTLLKNNFIRGAGAIWALAYVTIDNWLEALKHLKAIIFKWLP